MRKPLLDVTQAAASRFSLTRENSSCSWTYHCKGKWIIMIAWGLMWNRCWVINRNQIDYILCSQRWRSSIQSTKTRPGADCGSDHELLITKFRLNSKKVGKTTRPFRYDLNQIPFDYTVEVRNRFKGLDLIDRVSGALWTKVRDIVQETGIKTIPMEKKCKKAKWLSGRPYK